MEVGEFLRELGLQQYEAAFRDNRIDIRVLPKLTAEDLKEPELWVSHGIEAAIGFGGRELI
jgi:SAM domain (Sterile alpha motif)